MKRATSATAKRQNIATVVAAAKAAEEKKKAAAAEEAAHAAAQREAVEAASEERERTAWQRAVDGKKTMLKAMAFFSTNRVRELRPERHKTVGSAFTAAEKWKKVRDSQAGRNFITIAQQKAKATKGRSALFDEEHHEEEDAPYWKQGDASMHTQALWEIRMDLSTHPMVLDELHNWWLMLGNSFGPGAIEDEAAGGAIKPRFAGLNETMYGKMQLRLYKALITPFDPTDARKCARDDWKADRKGNNMEVMDRLTLNESLFELADVWTLGSRGEEYALFLRLLFDAIAGGDPPSLKPLAAISFADLPRQAAELTDMREAERAAAAAKTRKRSMDLARRMSKFESAALVTSAGRRATLAGGGAEAERAAAAAAVEELAKEEEAEAEAQRALERDQEEKEEAEALTAAELRAARKAAQAAAEKVAKEQEDIQRAAKRMPHGIYPNSVPPSEVIALWAKRATKPARDNFQRPTTRHVKRLLVTSEVMQHYHQHPHPPAEPPPPRSVLGAQGPKRALAPGCAPAAPAYAPAPSLAPAAVDDDDNRTADHHNTRHSLRPGHRPSGAPGAAQAQHVWYTLEKGASALSYVYPEIPRTTEGQFRPQSARKAKTGGLPGPNATMQMALWRNAPVQMRAFYLNAEEKARDLRPASARERRKPPRLALAEMEDLSVAYRVPLEKQDLI